MKVSNKYIKLLEPGRIGKLQLKNRFIMASMGTRLSGVMGEVTDANIEWYSARARGGTALITVEATHVAAELFPIRGVIRMLRADDDCFMTGLSNLAEIIHEEDAKASIQLSVGKAASTGTLWLPGKADLTQTQGMAPSAVDYHGVQKPREMTISEIEQTVKMFGIAAARVKKCGFDAVEVHAHFHSIPGCFLSPLFNIRQDKYGGSLENRMRFLIEIIESIRARVGQDFPILVKYSVNEFVAGGTGIEDGLVIGQRLEKVGVDALVVSQGQIGSKEVPYAPFYWPEGFMVPLAEKLKSAVNIPVVVGGQLGNPELAEKVLEEGKGDFVALGRALIVDTDFPRKLMEGRSNQIRRCIADNWCWELCRDKEIRCTLNAAAGREEKYGLIQPARTGKNVIVVGSGPAGLEAARVAGIRGHRVQLYEKGNSLGCGQLKLAVSAPHKEILAHITDFYRAALNEMENVEVKLGCDIKDDDIIKAEADVVIIATGGQPLIPQIPGIELDNVVTAADVLSKKVNIRGKKVIMCGGSAVGCETADLLAKQGNSVSIVEMRDSIGADMESISFSALKEELLQNNVKIFTGRKIESFSLTGVNVVDRQGKKETLSMEKAILALGTVSENKLADKLKNKVKELHVIGDAKKPGKIHDAIHNAFVVASRI